MIRVQKFGGTSLATLARMEKVATALQARLLRGEKVVVVVSAMSGETERLHRLAQKAGPGGLKGSSYDMLLSSGEQVSVALMALTLQKKNISAVPLLAHQVGIETDTLFSKARIHNIRVGVLRECLRKGQVPVVAGFQGVSRGGQITTLGRGGSDTTAVALAAALKQKSCEIFTDVPKVYTADPRMLKEAVPLLKLGFEEMMEMASLGSRVLHFRSVEIAAKYGIRIHVRSAFGKEEGTWIVPREEIMEAPLVSAVPHDLNTVIVKMFPIPRGTGFITRLFQSLAEKSISVDVISQSENEAGGRLAFSIHKEDLEETRSIIYRHTDKKRIKILKNVAKLSVVGVGMAAHPGAAARFFKALDRVGVHLHLVTTSEIKISAVIDKKHLKEALKEVHREFQLKPTGGGGRRPAGSRGGKAKTGA